MTATTFSSTRRRSAAPPDSATACSGARNPRKNGGEPQSPLGELVATAADEGYGPEDTAYHGYRYRLLTSQGPAAPGGAYDYVVRENQIGGFAVVAFPAAYGDSGVMTFMLSHEGVVYQKDLGEHTETEARKMRRSTRTVGRR